MPQIIKEQLNKKIEWLKIKLTDSLFEKQQGSGSGN